MQISGEFFSDTRYSVAGERDFGEGKKRICALDANEEIRNLERIVVENNLLL